MNAYDVDALVNAYLFDMELYKDSQEEGHVQLLAQERSKILRCLQQMKPPDLKQLVAKYQTQAREIRDEIEWRQARGKTRDVSREIAEKALCEILNEIQKCLKHCEDATSPREIQKKKAEEVLSKEPVFEVSRDYLALEPEFQPPESVYDIEYEELSLPSTPLSLKIAADKKKGSQDGESISTKAKKPSLDDERMTTKRRNIPPSVAGDATKTQKVASDRKKVTGKTPDEESESKPPKTQEERIANTVTKYLSKRPKVNWEQRDRDEKEMKQKLFEKETQLKKENEQFREEQTKKDKKKKWWL